MAKQLDNDLAGLMPVSAASEAQHADAAASITSTAAKLAPAPAERPDLKAGFPDKDQARG